MIAKTVLVNAKVKKRMQKNPKTEQISATKGKFLNLLLLLSSNKILVSLS